MLKLIRDASSIEIDYIAFNMAIYVPFGVKGKYQQKQIDDAVRKLQGRHPFSRREWTR